MKKKLIVTTLLGASLILGNWVSWLWQNWKNIVKEKKKEFTEAFAMQKEDTDKTNYDHMLNIKINETTPEKLRIYINYYVNQLREKKWLKPLKLDNKTNKVAQDYSKYLYDNHKDDEITYEDHFDKEGNWVLERVRWAGIMLDKECYGDCKKVWENLATSNMTIKTLVDMWMNSLSHRDNILGGSFNYIWIWHYIWSNNVVAVFVNLWK